MRTEIRYLEAFYQSAGLLSFTKAAHELGIAVSAVSRQIKLLEQSLGAELFVRGTRSVVLTERGQQYYQLCREFFEALSTAKSSLPSSNLKIGLLQSTFESLMKSGFSEFLRQHNGFIEFYINSPKRLVEVLRDRQVDLTLSNEPSLLPGFKAIELYREHIVLVAGTELSPRFKPTSPPPQVRCIVCTPFERHWQKTRLSLDTSRTVRINSVNGALELVRRGVGISVMPAELVNQNKDFDIFPLKGGFETIYLNTLNTFEATPAFKSLYRFLRTRVRQGS